MGSVDRSKKRIPVWKKVLLHFSLCFVTGFFTGFAPTSTASLFSGRDNPYRSVKNLHTSAKPVDEPGGLNRSLMTSKTTPTTNRDGPSPGDERQPNLRPALTSSTSPKVTLPLAMAADRALVIVVTTATRSGDPFRGALLRRLASTLKLVPPPLLWIVVEASSDATGATADILRKTGVMYRHLTYKEKLTGAAAAETDRYQRNVALNHVELHRLNGVVHFADVANVYDLGFFEEIREIEVFGTWPVVTVSANRKRVVVEGPVCSSSKVAGWQSKDLSSRRSRTLMKKKKKPPPPPPPSRRINTFGFAFKSSILWDPERWGRRSSSSVPDISQDSVKFVQEEVLEDENKLRGIPTDCSKVMLWHLHIPRALPPPPSQRD